MATLTDYLDAKSLQQFQDAFTAVAQVPIRICDVHGNPVTPKRTVRSKTPPAMDMAWRKVRRGKAAGLFNAPITIGNDTVGRVALESAKVIPDERLAWLLRLMAGMVGQIYDRQAQLRDRLDDLAALYRLTADFTGKKDLQQVLDTVAHTVVQVMKAKGSSIRLLNENGELIIKAVHNLSKTYLAKGPILVKDSKIDQEVFKAGKPLYIADERTDPRVLYPAQARREGIVSALVAPMTYKGRHEGIIRVYTGRKHEFDWFEISLLEAIAAQAAAALVNARLYQQAVHAAGMKRQLEMAADVQRRMIPDAPPKPCGFDISTAYVPCFELGGDFYDFIDLPGDNMGLVICDVSGKGVRASLLMASIRASLRAHAANIYDMSEVVSRVNRDLCQDQLTSDFATMFYGVLDCRNRRLTYANAGHPPPLLLRQRRSQTLSTGGFIIGVEPERRYVHRQIALQADDVILMYTDGLSEAMNFSDEAFGQERIERAALASVHKGASAEGVIKHVLWEMRRFTGLQTRGDDLTMVAVKVLK